MIAPKKPLESPSSRKVRPARARHYESGENNRFTGDWYTSETTPWQNIFNFGQNLRHRAQEMERRDPLTRKYLAMVDNNVLGPAGIRLQAKPKTNGGDLDEDTAKIIEAAWHEWGESEFCTMSGAQTWRDVEGLVVRRVPVDGESFVRKFRGAKNPGGQKNPWGFSIEVLDSGCVDEYHNVELKNNRRIYLGIEQNEYGRALAYHCRAGTRWGASLGERLRVPARDMVHVFMMERPNQWRGISWLSAVNMRSNMLDRYIDAIVKGSRVAANKMGFFVGEQPRASDVAAVTTDYDADESEAAEFDWLGEDGQFINFDPGYPPANFQEFTKTITRNIAAGLNVGYNTLASDMEGVNFSSLRHDKLTERDAWQCLHKFYSQRFHRSVYLDWLEMALISNAIKLSVGQYDQIREHLWRGRSWPWIDPLKDINALKVARDMGLPILRQYAHERNMSVEELLDEMVTEQNLIKAKGLESQLGGGFYKPAS